MSNIDFKKIDKALDEVSRDTGTVETGNTFRVAYAALKAGYAVRRASWLGYWVRVGEDVVMHCKDGRVISQASCDCCPMFTLSNTLACDWVILDEAHRKELDEIHSAKLLLPAADQAKAEKILKKSRKAAGLPSGTT